MTFTRTHQFLPIFTNINVQHADIQCYQNLRNISQSLAARSLRCGQVLPVRPVPQLRAHQRLRQSWSVIMMIVMMMMMVMMMMIMMMAPNTSTRTTKLVRDHDERDELWQSWSLPVITSFDFVSQSKKWKMANVVEFCSSTFDLTKDWSWKGEQFDTLSEEQISSWK